MMNALYGRNWASKVVTGLTSAAATSITVPTTQGITVPPHIIRVKAPSSNMDVVYFADITATTATLPLSPGDQHDLPCNRTSISALAASGSQSLIILAFYR